MEPSQTVSWWVIYTEPRREFMARYGLSGLPFDGKPHSRHTERGEGLSFVAEVLLPYDRITRRRPYVPPQTRRQRMAGVTPRTQYRPAAVCLEPLWPRYLFMDTRGEVDFERVRGVRGVVDVVRGEGDQPVEIPAAVADAIRKTYGSGGVNNEADVSRLSAFFKGKPGDSFVFRPSSKFAGLVGIIESLAKLDSGEELSAWVAVFGRMVRVEVPFVEVGHVIGGGSGMQLQAA